MARDVNPTRSSKTPERWEDYFDHGERLIWEGAPKPGLHIGPGGIFLSLFGMPFLAAGLGTLAGGLSQLTRLEIVSINGASGLFLIFFSFPFIFAGCALVVGPWIAGPLAARRIRYALSDRRAYIAQSFWNRSMKTYAIGPDDPVELERGRQADTVRFNVLRSYDSDGDRVTTKVGFENIADGERVYKLIRDMQREQA